MDIKHERLGKLRDFDPLTGEEIDLGHVTYRSTGYVEGKGLLVMVSRISEALESEELEFVEKYLTAAWQNRYEV